MTERGHIFWRHTLLSKISFNFIVVKPSHNCHNYSDVEILHKKGDMNKGDPFIGLTTIILIEILLKKV